MNKKNRIKKMVIGMVVISLTTATITIVNSNIKSKASEENISNIVNSKEENSKDFYEETLKNIHEIKDEYNVDETITNKEELKESISSVNGDNEQIGEVLAATEDSVLVEVMLDEYLNSMNLMEDNINDLNETINNENDTLPENMEVKYFTNGDFSASVENTNEYGMKTVCKIDDKSDNITRAWTDHGITNGPVVYAPNGDRHSTFAYEQYWGKYNMSSLRFIAYYKVSSAGLQAKSVKNDGSCARFIACDVKMTKAFYDDKVATHNGANIDGTVEFNIAGGRGMNIGGINFPSVAQYNAKFNFWVTLHSIQSGGANVSRSYHLYKDQVQIFS